MTVKEYYHTLEQYPKSQIAPFLKHVGGYLAGKLTKPVSKTSSINVKPLTFTFSDELLRRFVENQEDLKKPYDVAMRYGFRGYSKGERNGIFYQNEKDKKMIVATNRLIKSHKSEILEDLDIAEEGLDSLRKVKIVWYNPIGERVVGVYTTKNSRAIFLDFASY
jgi:hypothetical protein